MEGGDFSDENVSFIVLIRDEVFVNANWLDRKTDAVRLLTKMEW